MSNNNNNPATATLESSARPCSRFVSQIFSNLSSSSSSTVQQYNTNTIAPLSPSSSSGNTGMIPLTKYTTFPPSSSSNTNDNFISSSRKRGACGTPMEDLAARNSSGEFGSSGL